MPFTQYGAAKLASGASEIQGEKITTILDPDSRVHLVNDGVLSAIEAILAKGDRVELIPVKDGVKVVHIKRENVKF